MQKKKSILPHFPFQPPPFFQKSTQIHHDLAYTNNLYPLATKNKICEVRRLTNPLPAPPFTIIPPYNLKKHSKRKKQSTIRYFSHICLEHPISPHFPPPPTTSHQLAALNPSLHQLAATNPPTSSPSLHQPSAHQNATRPKQAMGYPASYQADKNQHKEGQLSRGDVCSQKHTSRPSEARMHQAYAPNTVAPHESCPSLC